MQRKITTLITAIGICFAASGGAAAQSSEAEARIAELQAEIERLRHRTKVSEAVVRRGTPANISRTTISVFIPENASNIKISVYMKNEPWGGHQNPPKPNTDDLGTSHYLECPTGSGECPIGWAKVGSTSSVSLPNGRTKISATFANWAHRNDRTGKLQVEYQLD